MRIDSELASRHTDATVDAAQYNSGTVIAEARQAKGLSRAELAQQLGLDVSTLSRIETGKRPISRKLRPRLYSVLGLDPRMLSAAPVMPGDSPGQRNPSVSPWEDGDRWKVGDYCESEAARIISSGLSEPVAKDLNRFVPAVIKYVRNAWMEAYERRQGEPIPYVARRGPNHCLAMMRILFQRFSRALRGLAPPELRILAAAIWVHDLGLTLDKATTDSGGLNTYHEWSESHVWENYYSFGLWDPEEAKAVGTLCRFHRNTNHLPDLEISGAGRGLPVNRQKTLIALLRLGNLMDVHYNRVCQTELHSKVPLPIDFQSELLRNLFVTRLYEDRHFLRAEVTYSPDWGESRASSLMSMIERDLRTELSRIKDVLTSNLQHIDLLWTKVVGGAYPDPSIAAHLLEATRFLGTSRSPNAARVLDDLLGYLSRHLSSSREPGVCEAAKSAIDELVKTCSQHAQLLNLQDRAREAKDVLDLRAIVQEFLTDKRKAYHDIAAEAQKVFKPGDWFVLFGFSAAVLEALKALGQEVQACSTVFVLECRNKTLYGPENTVEYCDGVQYALRVRELGYKQVYLASDSCAAYILAASKREPAEWEPYFKRPGKNKIYVLLGADGIDPNDASAWSTVGCLPLALAAKEYEAKVYVLAEPNKLRRGLEWPQPREAEWLTSEPAINGVLDHNGIEKIHPLNERLPSKLVTWFPPLDPSFKGEHQAANGKKRRREQ
jgi:translation initiation factor 2B subunit (eIF-2B alpha/beta/delta family)/transcriptional regulator with XRE-family HTH domain